MFPPSTRILVTDDMMMMRSIQQKILNAIGYTDVSQADNGEAGLALAAAALAEGKPFGLILSDWMMPKMKGIDFLKKVRSTKGLEKTPFVLITAEIEKQQVMEAIQAGVTLYITKPFTEESIRAKLKQAWEIASKKAA